MKYLTTAIFRLGLVAGAVVVAAQGQIPDGPEVCRQAFVLVTSPDRLSVAQCRAAVKKTMAAWNFDLKRMGWSNPARTEGAIRLRFLSDERMPSTARALANPQGRFTVRMSLIEDPSLDLSFAHELGHIQAFRMLGPRRSEVPDYFLEGHGLLMNWLYAEQLGRHHFTEAKTIMGLTAEQARNFLSPDYDKKHTASMERMGLFFVEYLRAREGAPEAATKIGRVFELVGQNRTFEQAFAKVYGLPLKRAIADVVALFKRTEANPAERLKGTCFEEYLPKQ